MLIECDLLCTDKDKEKLLGESDNNDLWLPAIINLDEIELYMVKIYDNPESIAHECPVFYGKGGIQMTLKMSFEEGKDIFKRVFPDTIIPPP